MEIKGKIQETINKALKNLEIKEINFEVEHPEDFKNGDYSTNVALVGAKILKMNPKELAQKIQKELEKDLPEEISKIETAGAGFINFYLSADFFSSELKEILTRKNFNNDILKGQKFFIEHTQPNPFKEFHIGHLMNNAIGESIARIVKAGGAEVKTATYHGDVGMHVAKAIYGYQKTKDWNKSYALGNKAYEEEAKKEIEEINKKIYDRSDKEINNIYDEGRKISLDKFEDIYKQLGSHFDYHFFESEAGQIGRKLVEKSIGEIFERGENGAVIFKGEDFGLHTRVFLNSEGLPTYEAKEIGLAEIKKEKFKYDKSVTITANEQNDFFKVVEVAIGQIFPELKGKLRHFSHGMLRLPSGKMSSRTGDVITAENLIDEVKGKAQGNVSAAIAAIKYMILRQAIGGDTIFDIEKSVSTEGDSGVYLQYSHARANSIVEKATAEGVKENTSRPEDFEITELEKMLYRFPEVIAHAMEDFAPHYITTYLTELARSFNSFYGNKIIVKKDDQASPYKVALTHAFQIVMKNGLYLLGIEAPERM